MQCNAMQHNAMQCQMQCNAMQCQMQCNAMPNAMQCNAMANAMQCTVMQCNAKCNAKTRDASELKGPQRRPQNRLDEVAKAVGGGYCRLQMLLSLALGVRGTVAGHRLGALEVGGGDPPPFRCMPVSLAPFHFPFRRWCSPGLGH